MSNLLDRRNSVTKFIETPEPASRATDLSELAFAEAHDRYSWKSAIDELLRIRLLSDDWDGEGSLAPEQEVVDSAIRMATDFDRNRMPPPDRVVVTVNGTIIFERIEDGTFMEIEVSAIDSATLRIIDLKSKKIESFDLT